MNGRISVAVLTAAIAVAATGAMAADFGGADDTTVVTEPVPPGGWHLQLTPYAWFTGVSGSITARGRTVETSASFFDLVENSDELIPFMGYFEASKDRFAIFGDFFYSRIGFSDSRTVQKNPVAGLTISATSKSSLDTTLTIAQLAAVYDVAQWQDASLGFYAGARYWHTNAELSLKITGEVELANLGLKRKGQYAIARTGGTDWVDPIVGMRVRQQLTPRDEIALLADIGGFGVGSEFSWQVFGGYTHSWNISRDTQMALTLGYRILSVDYEQGSGTAREELDLVLHGPLAGLSFRW